MMALTYLTQNIDPNALHFIEEPERAMQPDIKQGSIVTFNSNDISIKNGDIFVIRIGETVCSRILFSQPNGDILIRAKEPDFPDYVVKPQDASFTILGKVVFVTNRFN
jgi:phage repressor protein C with HTH and peptisase S24 domain